MPKNVIVHARYINLIEFNEPDPQLDLEILDNPPQDHILFSNSGELLHLDFSNVDMEIYNCSFSERKMLDYAYYDDIAIPHVDFVHTFNAYKDQNTQTIFFNTSTEIAIKFIKKYNTKLRQYGRELVDIYPIDFENVERRSMEIKASWFSTAGANVTSQALIGNDLQDSVEFSGLKDIGDVSSLTISLFIRQLDRNIGVIISKKGSIYIQNKLPDHINPIDILWLVFRHLIFD